MRHGTTLFIGALFLTSAAVAADTPAAATNHFTDNALRKTVNTLQHPNAEFFDGRTYVVYQGPREDPYVCAYDHRGGTWAGPVKAGTSLLGEKGVVDNHGIPVLFVDGEGYIHVVFGGHGANKEFGLNPLGKNGSGAQQHVVTERPGDITSWKKLENISPFGTYPQVIKMDDGMIYLFYRHGSHQSNWVYQTSKDNGRTFTPPESILKTKVAARGPGLHDAWYAVFNRGTGNTIVCSYVYHECGDGDLHDKNGRFNLYFMRMNCDRGNEWENVQGKKLGVPLTFEDSNASTLVFPSAREKLNAAACYADSNGNPHILFRGKNRQQFGYTRWTGKAWQEASVVAEADGAGEAGELFVKSPTEVEVIAAVGAGPDKSELNIYKTTDGGLTWNKAKTIDSASDISYSLGVKATNSRDNAFLIFGKTPNSDDEGKPARKVVNGKLEEGGYGRLFLWGDGGYVQRKSQAGAPAVGSR